jgi:hypothetical protein
MLVNSISFFWRCSSIVDQIDGTSCGCTIPFSASLDLVAHLPSIIVALIAALTSSSVLMSTGILISFSEVQHLIKIHSFKV